MGPTFTTPYQTLPNVFFSPFKKFKNRKAFPVYICLAENQGII